MVGYEQHSLSVIVQNLRKWLGIFPYLFPEEEFYWHLIMLTQGEYESYSAYWNHQGVPLWAHIPPQFKPSRYDFAQLCGNSGIIFAQNYGFGGNPALLTQRFTPYPPATFWHEVLGHAMGCDYNQSDYDTIHFDKAYHCGSNSFPREGECPQLSAGDGQGLCASTLCVRCRACAHRFLGITTNFAQTQAEHDWLEANFPRPYPCWQGADMSGQMDSVYGYDYGNYPLLNWHWDNNLAWYYGQATYISDNKVHIILERTTQGGGIVPTDIFTAENDYVFDPVDMVVKDRGFLSLPQVAVRGDSVSCVAVDDNQTPISGVVIKRNSVVIGTTDAEGKVLFVA